MALKTKRIDTIPGQIARRPGKVIQEIEFGPMDVIGPVVVEINISGDRKSVWVNVDGECMLRMTRVKKIISSELTNGR